MANEQNMQGLIVVKQLPVIQEELQKLRELWDKKAEDALAMVCTNDTVQDLKKIRADMRKEFDSADAQRKAVKAQYLAPWDAVEETFRTCIKDSFVKADTALKDQISNYETELKKECREKLEAFFSELVAMEQIDFLTLDQAMAKAKVSITMADTAHSSPRRLQDAVAEVVSSIAVGMDQISKMDDSAEIMTEFRSCLDVGKAVSIVLERKKKIAEAEKAAEERRTAQERFKAVEEKVQASMPPVANPASDAVQSENDPIFESFTFTVYGARKSQLIKIREFMKGEGVNYA